MSSLTENRLNEVLDPAALTAAITALDDFMAALPEGALNDDQRRRYTGMDVDNRVFVETVLDRSEEHTSELRHVKISYAVFCLKKKRINSVCLLLKEKCGKKNNRHDQPIRLLLDQNMLLHINQS